MRLSPSPQDLDVFAPVLLAITQLLRLIHSLSDEQYANTTDLTVQYNIGPHVRHCLDHIKALATGLSKGIVDYEDRDRESPCGTHRGAALLSLKELENHFSSKVLGQNTSTGTLISIRVANEVSKSKITIDTLESTVGREIAFVASHTVHHLAIIKLIGAAQGIRFEAEMGLAPGTQKWLQEQATCAP